MIGGLSFGLLIVLVLVLAAEFLNGVTDASNAIATVVSTRVLSPRVAVVMAALLNAIGALSGTAVAATIGKGFVRSEAIDLATIGAAMVAIVFWGSIAWYLGLPVSKSHALVASLTGAAFATGGLKALVLIGWEKVLLGLLFSTLLGFMTGQLVMLGIYRIFRRTRPNIVQTVFGRLQILSAAFMAFSHGSNDGQKFMGVFTLALVAAGLLPHDGIFDVPRWVILICSLTMASGTSIGGWRIIKTIGMRVVKLQPYQGFAAETGAGTAIELASRLGIPVSTTHTITTAIMGVGAARRLSAVRWNVAGDIVAAWIFTFPVCAVMGWLMAVIVHKLG